METTLLRSCLALPKVVYALRTCPPSFVHQALLTFDNLMRDALSDLVGAPLSDRSWHKASLPSSLGGLGIRRAILHAFAAYLSSHLQSQSLVSDILGHIPPADHLQSVVASLAAVAEKPEWCSVEDIDLPIRQRFLSRAIDEACHSSLLDSAPDARSKALALSSAIKHAGDWLKWFHHQPWASTFKIVNSAYACNIGWE